VAGSTTQTGQETTALCMHDSSTAGLPVAEKWRKSALLEPGQRVIHPGMFEDTNHIHSSDAPYGTAGKASDHVADVWNQLGSQSEFLQLKHDQKASVYHSDSREPLGRSYCRGHDLPVVCRGDSFSFGKQSAGSGSAGGSAAKTLLYPTISDDPSACLKQYIMSHGSYEPGQQRDRSYNWRLPLQTHRFGVGVGSHIALNGASHGVSSVLTSEMQGAARRITSKREDDFDNLADQLGRVRNLGHGTTSEEPNTHVYGKPSLRSVHEWDARSCIEGNYSLREQEPDSDLGCTHTPGFRNDTSKYRKFGVPTVRSDLPNCVRRSVADNQNYGDDVNAEYLLYPSPFSDMGISDDDFSVQRPTKEVYEIIKLLHPQMTYNKFYELVAMGKPCCSIADVQNTLVAMV